MVHVSVELGQKNSRQKNEVCDFLTNKTHRQQIPQKDLYVSDSEAETEAEQKSLPKKFWLVLYVGGRHSIQENMKYRNFALLLKRENKMPKLLAETTMAAF